MEKKSRESPDVGQKAKTVFFTQRRKERQEKQNCIDEVNVLYPL